MRIQSGQIAKESYTISSILKILTQCENNDNMAETIMNKYITVIHELSLHGKIRLGSFIRKHRPQNFKIFVDPFIDSLRNDVNQCRLKDLLSIAKCLADLNCSAKTNEKLFEKMMDAARERIKDSSHVHSGQYYIQFVFQMSRMSYYNTNVLNELFSITNQSDILKTAKSERELVLDGAFDVFSNVCHELRTKRLNRTTDIRKLFASHVNAFTLKQIAQLDHQLDRVFPDYQGVRLDSDLRQKLLSLCQR